MLVIDDQRMMVDVVEAMLRKAGYREVETVTNSREAIAAFEPFRPDLVLLDLHMSGRDGFDVLADLRDRGQATPMPVLMLTADNEPAVHIRALEAGVLDFLAKPIDEPMLLARVRNLAPIQLLQKRVRHHSRQLEPEVVRRTTKLERALDVLRHAETRLSSALDDANSASTAKSEFLANMSHELRTPLNAILGFSYIFRTEALGPIANERYLEYAGDIHDAGRHLLTVVNDVLDISKAEADRLNLDMQIVDVAQTVRGSVRMMAEQARAAGVRPSVDMPDDFPQLKIGEQRLRQVLLNIVSNAIKFTPSGGSVTVKGRHDRRDGAMIFVVSDTGIGMAPEDIPVAMSAYGQVRKEGIRRQQGTGLGLPLTKKLVAVLGGELTLESAPGRGTTVTIRFPADLVENGSDIPPRESAA